MELYEKILQEDYSFYDDLLSLVPPEGHPLLADHLVGVFLKQDKLVNLIEFVIKKEVQATKHYSLLFREDSLGKAVVNRVLFGTVGINYLKLLLSPLVKKLAHYNKPLEVVAHKVGEKEASENIKKLISAVDAFVTTFQESELSCPLFIRKLLMHLQHYVDLQFGKESHEVPFGIHFFFFSYVCVAMISCDRYNIVDSTDMTDSLRTGLINASKILKDLAGQTTKEGDHEAILQYHKEKGTVLAACFSSLIDSKTIDMAQRILMANVVTKIRREDIQLEKDSFLKFISHYDKDETGSSSKESVNSDLDIETELESPQTFVRMTERFLTKLNDPRWKLKKTIGTMELFTLKEKNVSTLSLRAEVIISAPLHETAEFFEQNVWSQKYDEYIGESLIPYKSGPYCERYIVFKGMFPISARDAVSSHWTVYPDKDRILQISNHNNRIPKKSGYVRALSLLSGFEYMSLSTDAASPRTRVRVIVHGDPRGSIPKWVVNAGVLNQAQKIVLMKKDLEAKFNTNSPLSTSKKEKSKALMRSSHGNFAVKPARADSFSSVESNVE